jgi:hypothetical protein
MVNLPRGQEVSGLHGAPSQLQGEILRLVRLDGLSVPYLIQQGYLQRTPRGRIATLAAYRHLGVTPRNPEGGLFVE